MASDFNAIMAELQGLLKEAEEGSGPAELGGSVVNGLTGAVGANSKAQEVKGDVSFQDPHKDVGALKRPDKESEYPDPIRSPNGGSSSPVMPRSSVGDESLDMEDKPEKRASLKLKRILNNIDSFLGTQVKQASVSSTLGSLEDMELKKAAAFQQGRRAALEYLQMLKKAEDDAPKNSPEHRGDLAETAVGQLVPRSDPHQASDNKSPESEPSQPEFGKAKKHDQGNVHLDDTLEAQASILVRKAQLMDEFEKAAYSKDERALNKAKAKIFDFLANN